MDLKDIREKIDSVDDKLNSLFVERMELAKKVAEYKKENNMPVLNRKREREIIARLTEKNPEELSTYTKILYNTLFDVSRSYQGKILNDEGNFARNLKNAVENTPKEFPKGGLIACQGTEGAYSQEACDRLFSTPSIMYFNNFKGVFNAVDKGLCRYGILPIENSIHGSVGEVYDLMQEYKFSIVRAVKMQINHSLLTKPGCKLDSIKEIFSHEQAIGQCEAFLSTLKDVKITVCENTAIAAKMVSESDRCDIAAISSKNCAELYGLVTLAEDIQSTSANYTRFICISKTPEVYPGADKMSMLLCLSHKPGSLYDLISKFSALGINISKIESRPIAGRDFEFMFYFDMEISVYSDAVIQLLSDLESSPEDFVFLGSYTEV